MSYQISKAEHYKNFKSAVLQLKISLLIALFRKYGWRYDENSLHIIIQKFGIENAIEYVRKDQKFYNRVIRSIYKIVSIGKNNH